MLVQWGILVLVYSFMYQNKKMALLPSAFFSFSFWCRYLLSLGTENVKTKRCKKKYLLTYCLFYSFFFPYKIYWYIVGIFFFKRAESHECCPQVQFPGWKSAYGNVIFFSGKDFYGICKWNKTSPWWYWQDAEKEADCVLTCLWLRSFSPNPAALWGSAAWWRWLLILSVTLCKMLFH